MNFFNGLDSNCLSNIIRCFCCYYPCNIPLGNNHCLNKCTFPFFVDALQVENFLTNFTCKCKGIGNNCCNSCNNCNNCNPCSNNMLNCCRPCNNYIPAEEAIMEKLPTTDTVRLFNKGS